MTTNDFHAEFAPSNAERRLNCLGSLGLEREAPPIVESTYYADRGHQGHEIAELILRRWNLGGRGDLDREHAESLRPVSLPLPVDPWDEPGETSTPPQELDLLDQALVHVEHCIELVNTFDRPEDVSVCLERSLMLQKKPYPMFGRVDFFATGFRKGIATVVLRDFKSGTSPVYAEKNPQLGYYAAMVRRGSLLPLEVFDVGVVQPRRKTKKKIVETEWNSEEMDVWEAVLVAGAAEAHRQAELPTEERSYTPGKWCFFCKAREVCQAKKRQEEERRKAKELVAKP